MNKHTQGNWTVFNMVHAERGDAMTPEEIGEYVKNNVLKSIEDGGSAERFLFISTGEENAPDIALIGNGPNGPANAALIAAAPELLAALHDLVAFNDKYHPDHEAVLESLESYFERMDEAPSSDRARQILHTNALNAITKATRSGE